MSDCYSLFDRLGDALRNLFWGVYHRYPVCCVLAFCWRTLRDEHEANATRMGYLEGCVMDNYRWVPCWLHRRLRPVVWREITEAEAIARVASLLEGRSAKLEAR